MANDLMIVGKIEKRLRTPRIKEENVFPLSPTHRKELRALRDKNISGVKSRLQDIQRMKKDEFFNKYREKIEEKANVINPQVKKLNEKFEELKTEVNNRIEEIKKLENESNMDNISVDSDYSDIARLKTLKSTRVYSKDSKAIEKALKNMFEERFGERFKTVQQKIDKMLEQYEEAINFGDLEIVKELYYSLKDADGFLDEVAKIKV
jgi:hypothetical protein